MRKTFNILILLLLWCNTSFGQSMKSLQEFTKENENYVKDPIVQTYVLKRCGAAYLYVASITKDRDRNMAENFLKASDKLLVYAGKIVMLKLKLNTDEAGKNIIQDVDIMRGYYEKDGTDSFARTGSYTSNNYIGEDLSFCKGIAETIK